MAAAKSSPPQDPDDGSHAKTRPISFRVSEAALDTLIAAGRSPVEIGRAAIEREARIAKTLALLEDWRKHPLKVDLGGDSVTVIRKMRDSR